MFTLGKRLPCNFHTSDVYRLKSSGVHLLISGRSGSRERWGQEGRGYMWPDEAPLSPSRSPLHICRFKRVYIADTPLTFTQAPSAGPTAATHTHTLAQVCTVFAFTCTCCVKPAPKPSLMHTQNVTPLSFSPPRLSPSCQGGAAPEWGRCSGPATIQS